MVQNRSLRNNVDAIDKINDIRLSLNSERGSKIVWILVEGEDDCKIYPKFFDENKARVEFVNGGKIQLTIALNTLTKETEKVIGIQDADFAHLEKNYPDIKNLFYTDYHDIEITMLQFDSVINNLFTEYRMQDKVKTIWQNVLQESSFIAYIRWYNEKKQCKINFSGIGYGDLISLMDSKIILKNHELLNELNKRSKNKTEILTFENIEYFIIKNTTDDFLNLCNGHDVTALLSLVVGGQVSYTEFCRHLRLSFNFNEFRKTKLYSKISDWQKKHGYTVFKNVA
ncbi:MAG: DUF4435 domain-containing protein [Prevotellaceae bacterium]|jgi:hypothetical protein|nr:DUF4435 domain-containing protein [Prevotellaceae bacterium]